MKLLVHAVGKPVIPAEWLSLTIYFRFVRSRQRRRILQVGW